MVLFSFSVSVLNKDVEITSFFIFTNNSRSQQNLNSLYVILNIICTLIYQECSSDSDSLLTRGKKDLRFNIYFSFKFAFFKS